MKPLDPRRTDIHRGEVWQVNFDPTVGVEINKTRPAVVIGEDNIGILPLQLVVPITEWKPHYSRYVWFTRISVSTTNGLIKESGADGFQIKSFSEARFIEKVGVLTSEEMKLIADSIALCIGFDR